MRATGNSATGWLSGCTYAVVLEGGNEIVSLRRRRSPSGGLAGLFCGLALSPPRGRPTDRPASTHSTGAIKELHVAAGIHLSLSELAGGERSFSAPFDTSL